MLRNLYQGSNIYCYNSLRLTIKNVYTAAIKNVREKCGVNIAKGNIESRSKTFDKHYNIINGMLSSSGFGWDWERNKLSIDSESVWESYVEGEVDSSLERRGRREG
ncbi:hypothetical protein EJB05_11523, partial [Eragrostis curvula]